MNNIIRLPGWTVRKGKFCLLCCFAIILLRSQAQTQPWSATIAALGNLYGNSIVQCSDGGFAVGGYLRQPITMLSSRLMMYAAKVDSSGNLLWTRYFGSNVTNTIGTIALSKDGGFALAGYTNQFGAGGADVYIVKLDASGNFKWAKTIGGTDDDAGSGFVSTKDGGYVITGYTLSWGNGTQNKLYVVKLDSLGNKQWTKTLGGTGGDEGGAIVQTKDGGYAITGATASFGAGGNDVYVVKLDSLGNIQWTKTIGGAGNDEGNAIIQSRDGGYAIAGSTNSYLDTGVFGGSGYIIKLDSSGNFRWSIAIGENTSATSIVQAANGDFVIAGSSNYDACFIRVDTLGNVKDTLSYATDTGIQYISSSANAIIQTKSGGYAMAGSNVVAPHFMDEYYLYILVLDSAGRNCNMVVNGMPLSTGGIMGSGGVVMVSDSGIVGAGDTSQTGGVITMQCELTTSAGNEKTPSPQIEVYPNPSNGIFSFVNAGAKNFSPATIEVYNVLGERVKTQCVASLQTTIDLGSNANGVYFYRVIKEDGELLGEGKLVIAR